MHVHHKAPNFPLVSFFMQVFLQVQTSCNLHRRWYNEEEEIEVEEDTSPKYVNGKRVLVNKEIQ